MPQLNEVNAWFIGRFNVTLTNAKNETVDTACTLYAWDSSDDLYPAKVSFPDPNSAENYIEYQGRLSLTRKVLRFEEATRPELNLPEWVATIVAYESKSGGELIYSSTAAAKTTSMQAGIYGHDDAVQVAQLEKAVNGGGNRDALLTKLESLYSRGKPVQIRTVRLQVPVKES